MVLARSLSSLPMMLKWLVLVLCPVCRMCAWMGEGCLRCFLYLSPSDLAVSPIYSSLQVMSSHLLLFITLLLLSLGSLGSHECLLDCGVALEVCLYPILTTYIFEAFLIIPWCMVPLYIPPWVWALLL